MGMIAYKELSLNAPAWDTRYRYYPPALSVSPIFPIKLSVLLYEAILSRISEDTPRFAAAPLIPGGGPTVEEGTNNLPISALLAH